MAKKYIVILTEKELQMLQAEVMTEFSPYVEDSVPKTRRVFANLTKKINEAIEV